MTRLRMGYVGCGFMAQSVHIPNLVSLPDCDLVAIAELRPELAEKVRARYRIPKHYKSHVELSQDPEIEAVGVSAHFALQGEIAIDLLNAGKHVFMEKPMAVSITQAERILGAVEDSGCRLMVGYMKRYDAGNELVKRIIDQFLVSGELGAITYVRNHGFCGNWTAGADADVETTEEPMPHVNALAGKPDWLPDALYPRYLGYLQQYTHNINLLRWFLDTGDNVTVQGVHLGPDGMRGIVVLDLNGTQAIIESGRVAYHGWDEHTQIFFEKGWIKTDAPPLLLKNVPATVHVYRAEPSRQVQHLLPDAVWSWSYRRELAHFCSCILDDVAFRSSGQDTMTDVRIFEDIFRLFVAKAQ